MRFGWGLALVALTSCVQQERPSVVLAPEDGAQVPTNAVMVIETARTEDEVAPEIIARRAVNGGPEEDLFPMTTRCGESRCFTPVPIGPLSPGARVEVAISVDDVAFEREFVAGERADNERAPVADVVRDAVRAEVTAPDEEVALVLLEYSDGSVIDGRAGLEADERFIIEGLDEERCTGTLVLDFGGNLSFGEPACP